MSVRYCYRCPTCGATREVSTREVQVCENLCDEMVRDYRAENVGVGSGVRVSRDGTVRDQARLMLPTNDDFKGPGDPDGTKGMRRWHDRFQPAADNPRPASVGEIDKRVF